MYKVQRNETKWQRLTISILKSGAWPVIPNTVVLRYFSWPARSIKVTTYNMTSPDTKLNDWVSVCTGWFNILLYDHITPLLRDLHWLRVPERVKFRLCVLVYRCLHGTAPSYLADDLQLTSAVSTMDLTFSSGNILFLSIIWYWVSIGCFRQ